MQNAVPNVMFNGIPIVNANKGKDVRPHTETECSEEDQQENEESDNGLPNVHNSGSTNHLHKIQTPFLHVEVFPKVLPDFIKTQCMLCLNIPDQFILVVMGGGGCKI